MFDLPATEKVGTFLPTLSDRRSNDKPVKTARTMKFGPPKDNALNM